MLTLQALQQTGADTESGMARCLNNEEFYLKMVRMAIQDGNFAALDAAVAAGDLEAAFERAHALKGILGNVSLTGLLAPVEVITEELRARKDMDYSELLAKIHTEHQKLLALLD